MKEQLLKSYAVRHRNQNVVKKSRSGGFFVALSDYIINRLDGVVYGAILNDNLEVIHIRAEDGKTRDLMCGSKYVQSQLGSTFLDVKKDLNNGRTVLFTGTSCQVMGLKKFLGSSYDMSHLFLLDIVCHGVPSPLVYRDYITYWEQKKGKKCVSVDFRNKNRYGWKAHVETLTFSDGDYVDSREYTKLFYSHKIIRPSCFSCPYKNISHPGDITIADCWGVENVAEQFNDDKGCSLVLINSIKGETIFNQVGKDIECVEINLMRCMQPPLIAPFPIPNEYNKFWRDYHSKGLEYVIKKYIYNTKRQARVDFIYRIKNKIVRLLSVHK